MNVVEVDDVMLYGWLAMAVHYLTNTSVFLKLDLSLRLVL